MTTEQLWLRLEEKMGLFIEAKTPSEEDFWKGECLNDIETYCNQEKRLREMEEKTDGGKTLIR